jgi:hypothetical protein
MPYLTPTRFRLSQAAARCGWPSTYKVKNRWVFIHRTDNGALQELRQGNHGPRSLRPLRAWPPGTKLLDAYNETVCRILREERRLALWLDYIRQGHTPEIAQELADADLPALVSTSHDLPLS